MLISREFRSLQTEVGAEKAKEMFKKKLVGLREETKAQVDLMRDLARTL